MSVAFVNIAKLQVNLKKLKHKNNSISSKGASQSKKRYLNGFDVSGYETSYGFDRDFVNKINGFRQTRNVIISRHFKSKTLKEEYKTIAVPIRTKLKIKVCTIK